VLRIGLTLGVFYLLLVVVIVLFQRRLLYVPTLMNPKVAEQIARREGFEAWRNTANQIIGWHWPAGATSNGVVLIVHGNAGCAVDRSYFAEPIRAGGSVDVFVLEYPGYGVRDGSPSEASLLTAAEEAFNELPTNGPIFIVGESLGTGVAAHLAKRYGPRISGLILFAPYNDLASVAQEKMPILPVRLLLQDRFNSAEWLREYRGPVAIVLAEADEIIPAKFGRRLYDGYSGPKKLETIPAAHHNEIGIRSPEWWRDIFEFWAKGQGAIN
jgi:pimeloyl-ACP methyl ester carboxylesterase